MLKNEFGETAEMQMAELLKDTPPEITTLLEVALPIGTQFQVLENFKGKCWERRRGIAKQNKLEQAQTARTKYESLPAHVKMLLDESADEMTFKSDTEWASKVKQMLVMWAELRENQGKKVEKIQRHERPGKI